MSVSILREAVDVARLSQSVQRASHGAVVTFAGVVRERSDDDRTVEGLSYEAYEPMAVAEIERIVAEARERFGPCDIAVEHRVGDLPVGEIAVGIAAAAPHRAQAFDACEYVIDELKHRAPIWKREAYADGTREWVDCRHGARR